METIEELFYYFKKNNIEAFITDSSIDTLCIASRLKNLVMEVDQIKINVKEGKFAVWENYHKKKWYTFIKYININEDNDNDIFSEIEDTEHYNEDFVGLTDVFSRDEIGDPDLLESWDDEAKRLYGEDAFNRSIKTGYIVDLRDYPEDEQFEEDKIYHSIWDIYLAPYENDEQTNNWDFFIITWLYKFQKKIIH